MTEGAKVTKPDTARRHFDPSGGRQYPSSMKLACIRDATISSLLDEEKHLRAELDKIKASQRKVADAKDANLRVFQPAADKFMTDILRDIDKMQEERSSIFTTMDELKVTQNEIGQMRDRVKLLEFELDPLHKSIADLNRRFADAVRFKESLDQTRVDASSAHEERVATATAKVDRIKRELDEKTADKKSKEQLRSTLREKMLISGDVAQRFDAAKERMKVVNARLDDLFSKKRQQKPQNKELDIINKELSEVRSKKEVLTKRLDEIRGQVNSTPFSFKPAFRGDLVGKQGATLAQLQEDFGVAINIDTAGEGQALLVGAADDVASCIVAMQSIVDNAERTRQKVVMSFDPTLARVLIGAKGSNIEKMQTVSGANIKIQDDQITLTGTQESIDAAKLQIEELIFMSAKVDIPFDPKLLDIVIGKGGSTVRKVEQESGAKSIRVLRDTNTIAISGTQAAVDKANTMYQELIQNMTQNAFTMRADDRMIRSVIGTAGKNIKEIQDTTGALVTCGRDVITVRGSKDAVATARRMIEDIGRREEIKVPFPSVMYTFLTSPAPLAGEATDDASSKAISPVEAIKVTSKCDQVVALQRDSVVVLRGRREHVSLAKSLLDELLRNNRAVSVSIPVVDALFGFLTRRASKAGDSVLGKLKVQFPKVHAVELQRSTSTVEISAANKDDASVAADALQAILSSVEGNIRKVEIPAGRAGAVIGSGGKVIGGIQSSTGTDIAVKKDTNVVFIFHEGGDVAKLDAAVAAVNEAANGPV